MEGIRKQAERCDAMEAFQVTHSIGGGTGSGLGCLIMQEVKHEFPDRMLSCYSVVPSKCVSDIVLEPYNAILAINHLIEECDSNILLDNEALYNIAQHSLKHEDVTFSFINKIIERAMLESTSSLRFGGFNNAGVRKLCTNLCPFPRLHFLTTTLAPISNMRDKMYEVMGARELTRELLSSKNALCMSELSKGKFLAGAVIFRGQVESSVAEESLAALREKNSSSFVDWIPDSLLSSICHVPNKDHQLSAILMGNTTSIQTVLKRMDDQYEPMFKRRAFMHHYIQQGLDWNEMSEAEMNVTDLISQYQQYEVAEVDSLCDEDAEEDDVKDEIISKTARSASAMSDHHSTHASSNKD